MTPLSQCPKLARLAHDCWDSGPVNLGAIVLAFAEAIQELPSHERKTHPCVPMIVGHLAFMIGCAAGPADEHVTAYREWLLKQNVLEKYNLTPKPAEMALAA
jgi:hypothetical protein